jgi:hypothetical protein
MIERAKLSSAMTARELQCAAMGAVARRFDARRLEGQK